MKIEGDNLIFSTGRKVYANSGIIGIGFGGGITEGYDGGLNDRDWTPAERVELAEYMIEQWKRYATEDAR